MTTSIKVKSQEGADWGNVFLEYKEEEYQFPCHIPSGEVFNHDSDFLIRFKCLALVGLTPLASLIRSVYWFATSIFMVLSEVYRYLDGQSPSEEAQRAIYENAYDSIRALGYGALMTRNALMGICYPYQGRLHYGWLERKLHHHLDGPHRNRFYLAFCFQRRAVLLKEDEHLDQVKEKLTKYLTMLENIWAAIRAKSIQQLMVELRIVRPVKT